MKGYQRIHVKGQAHHLEPIVRIGHNGVSEGVVHFIEKALESHELIKVKFAEFKDRKKELSQQIAESTDCEIIGIIGNTAIFFRQNPDPEKRKIRVPRR